MANWNKPDLSSYEVNVLDELKSRDLSLARMFKGTTDTNLPVDSIRLDWTGLVGRLGKWNGTTWDTLILSQDNLPSATSSVKGIAKIATTAEITTGTSTDTVVSPSGLSSARVASADKLRVARRIGGVLFDGSANIDLPGVNTTGNQNTTGNAATATDALNAVIAAQAIISLENRGSASALFDTDIISTTHTRQVNASFESRASMDYSQINVSNYSNAAGERSQVNASTVCAATGDRSQVNASHYGVASGELSQVNASEHGIASGSRSQVNASNTCTASGIYSQVNASTNNSMSSGAYSQTNASNNSSADVSHSQVNSSGNSTTSVVYSQINSSDNSTTSGGAYSQVNASRSVTSAIGFSSVWGHADTSAISSANQKIRLESKTGIGRFIGNTTTGGFDYAEYFPNLTQGVIPDGTIVTLVDEKIRPAQAGDFILGTVSATAGVIGNAPEFCWTGRYLKDEFGRELKEEADFVRWQSEDDFYDGLASECTGEIPDDAEYYTQEIPITNPDYVDISSDYKSRGDRNEEWSVVGLMGQVYVRVCEDIEHNTYVSADGKQSETETRLYCMKMTTPYSSEKGYGVAFCLLR